MTQAIKFTWNTWRWESDSLGIQCCLWCQFFDVYWRSTMTESVSWLMLPFKRFLEPVFLTEYLQTYWQDDFPLKGQWPKTHIKYNRRISKANKVEIVEVAKLITHLISDPSDMHFKWLCAIWIRLVPEIRRRTTRQHPNLGETIRLRNMQLCRP